MLKEKKPPNYFQEIKTKIYEQYEVSEVNTSINDKDIDDLEKNIDDRKKDGQKYFERKDIHFEVNLNDTELSETSDDALVLEGKKPHDFFEKISPKFVKLSEANSPASINDRYIDDLQ